MRGIGLRPMHKSKRVIVYEDIHGKGQTRVLWEDDCGESWVMWYGLVVRVAPVKMFNWPKNGMVTERYVIQWDGHMV